MEKIKIAEKALKNAFRVIYRVSYCKYQNILNLGVPNFCTCGIYGWKSDNYVINSNILISTGYAPLGKIDSGFDAICKNFDDRVLECSNWKDKITLYQEFCMTVISYTNEK